MTQSIRETPELAEEVMGELLLAAAEAREDRQAFFEFVMRDEVRNLPIVVAPHQALALEFERAHRHCVLMFPFGHSKTYTAAGILLQDAGDDELLRAAIVSAAQAQAEKPVQLVRQYIEESQELRLVYPKLERSRRSGEPWTMTDITIARPPGIRDATLVARGLDSRQTLGSRWKKVVIDDILNDENTRTPEQREKVWQHIQKVELPRLDPIGGRCVYLSTAWHPDDVTHRLIRPVNQGGRGWPGLVMDAEGDIFIHNAPDWDSPLIYPTDDRLAGDPQAAYRLVAHGRDPDKQIPLWPERWPKDLLDEQRRELHPAIYNQIFRNICRDDTSSLCKQADVDKALEVGRRLGIRNLRRDVPPESLLVFVGVDLAFSKSDAADESAIFVFAVYAEQVRVPLWIESGRWGTVELYNRLVEVNDRYRPAGIAVESNAAQEGLRQIFANLDKTLVLKPHRTDATKNTISMGVPSIFSEMSNGCWALPSDKNGNVHPQVRKLIDQCLYYTPSEHTGDLLMACYFARDLAKKYGALARPNKQGPAGIAANLMSR